MPVLAPNHIATHQESEGLPTWEEAHNTQIFTIRHIPKAAREDWARVLGATLNDICADPTNKNKWLLLYILACCLLPARPKTPEQSASKDVKSACKRWREGKAVELWEEAIGRMSAKTKGRGRPRKRREKEEGEPTLEEINARRAARFCQEGQLGRAAQALVSRGVDQTSQAAKHEMDKKHPQAEVPDPPEEPHSCPPIVVNSREVYKSIRGLKAGTVSEPSGMRAEHLKEAKGRGEGRGEAALAALTRLVNVMASGKVPKEVAPYLFGAYLFALVKKTGGHRPVAVGDIIRRLTSKCIAYKVAFPSSQWLRCQRSL